MIPFILILFGIILIIVNIKAINKEEKSFSSVLKYKKEDISEIEVEIGRLRKDLAESLTELQEEILEIRSMVEGKKVESVDVESLLDINEEDVINEINTSSKAVTIKELIDLGHTDDEICEKLSLGKGEVLLVRGLYKK